MLRAGADLNPAAGLYFFIPIYGKKREERHIYLILLVFPPLVVSALVRTYSICMLLVFLFFFYSVSFNKEQQRSSV